MLRAECEGKALAGNNVQVVVGVPDEPRYGLDRDVDIWLPSGWWLTFRNQFAAAPSVAREIVDSASAKLSAITAEAAGARGPAAERVTAELFQTAFEAAGPRYWN
jgi:hypothetical protein